ncbi:hypothetical protein IWW40_004445 [Coemansia sp. RSA 1250]|nr:hypothetical protein IWW40_004445 [Coemansia sp. RSA 1250]
MPLGPGLASEKQQAGVNDSTWKKGQRQAKWTQNKYKKFVVQIKPSPSSFYDSLPPVIPRDSELHKALRDQPVSRRDTLFNPWTLFLELLDDPRIVFNPQRNTTYALINTMSRLGWVTPHNIGKYRNSVVDTLLGTRCIGVKPGIWHDAGSIEITASELLQLKQIQWPRAIAHTYSRLLSVNSIGGQDSNELQNLWDVSWLTTNLSMLEMKMAYVKNRIVFDRRLDKEKQFRQVITGAIEHSPGLVCNAIMCWRKDPRRLFDAYLVMYLTRYYFANVDMLRSVICNAWQLYDWAIHNNPYQSTPRFISSELDHKQANIERWNHKNSSTSLLYDRLSLFDHEEEIEKSLARLDETCKRDPSSEMAKVVVPRLVQRYTSIKNAHPVFY